tara:strand:- start:10157 stop:10618 length:462 start_codon:yes stop_codon:yes gene_type:complete
MIKLLSKFTFVIFIFLTSCGYQPIYSDKNANFKINSISFSGDKNINEVINNRVKIYKDVSGSEKIFDLNINSKFTKIVTSKDTKGNVKIYKIELITEIKTILINSKEINKVLKVSSSYNNISNKFELKQYENNVIENLAERIAERIIFTLQTL